LRQSGDLRRRCDVSRVALNIKLKVEPLDEYSCAAVHSKPKHENRVLLNIIALIRRLRYNAVARVERTHLANFARWNHLRFYRRWRWNQNRHPYGYSPSRCGFVWRGFTKPTTKAAWP
jgi:hypothetical protein